MLFTEVAQVVSRHRENVKNGSWPMFFYGNEHNASFPFIALHNITSAYEVGLNARVVFRCLVLIGKFLPVEL